MILFLRRSASKLLDFAIIEILMLPFIGNTSYAQSMVAACVALLFYGVLFVYFLGVTPGKYIMGISVENKNGITNVLKREILIIVVGFGCLIPVASILTLIFSASDFIGKKSFFWDRATGVSINYAAYSDVRVYVISVISFLVAFSMPWLVSI